MTPTLNRRGIGAARYRIPTLLALVAALMLSFSATVPARAAVTTHGLLGEYYTTTSGPDFTFQELRASVLDGEVNHRNLVPVYDELVGRTELTGVRWTGQLTAPATGDYTFHAIGDNGFRLWVDGELVIDFWVDRWDIEQVSRAVTLTEGEAVDIRLELFQNSGGANMYLRWAGPGIAKQIIPLSAYTPPADWDGVAAAGSVSSDGGEVSITLDGVVSGWADVAGHLEVTSDGAAFPIGSVTAGDSPDTLVVHMAAQIPGGSVARLAYDGAGTLAVDGTPLPAFGIPLVNNSTYVMQTRWAADVDPSNPLPEYPRPLLARPTWQNLNGQWQFDALSQGDPTPLGADLSETVVVPYPIESVLSGIHRHEDHMAYRRMFKIDDDWKIGGQQRLLLHFDAVDQVATVYLNGEQLATHVGGYDRFTVDITDHVLVDDANELVVRVTDTTRDTVRGKQTTNPGGIFYTPASGIWGTVWLEPVSDKGYIEDLEITPDLQAGVLRITAESPNSSAKSTVTVDVTDADGASVASVSGRPNQEIAVPIPAPRLWSPEDPHLYDLEVSLRDRGSTDVVASYAGMRSISVDEVDGRQRILLNGERTFLLSTLDQGYWPDGVYTAPTDEALAWDIQATKDLGFNTIRKHIKVEPDRWYYHADRIGMLVWQDMPSATNATEQQRAQFLTELQTMVETHDSFPSIIGWVPMNEGWGEWDRTATGEIANSVKAWDPERIVNAHSGVNCCNSKGDSGEGDVIDHHAYTGPANPFPDATRAAIDGEHGGFSLSIAGHTWPGGSVNPYGEVESKEALTAAYVANTARLIRPAQENLSGAIYTQITDVEGEVNGFYTYDRQIAKMDFEQVRAINQKVIEVGAGNRDWPEPGSATGIARWQLDEGSGAVAADSIGGSELQIRGATWVDEANGAPGKALEFTGAGDSHSEAQLPGLDTTASYSVSAWVRMDSLPGNFATVAAMDSHTGASAFFLQYGAPVGGFAFSLVDGPRAVASGGAEVGRWYHLTGVRDAQAQTMSLYVDGALRATVEADGAPLGNGTFSLGRGQWGGGRVDFLDGAVDDVRVFTKALTAEEVGALLEA